MSHFLTKIATSGYWGIFFSYSTRVLHYFKNIAISKSRIKTNIQIIRLWYWRSILTYNCEMNIWCDQATNYFSEQNCNKLMNKPNPSRMFSVSHSPFEKHPRPLWPLRHLIRVMRKHDPTNKRTATKTKTNTMTNTFREHSDPWNFRP